MKPEAFFVLKSLGCCFSLLRVLNAVVTAALSRVAMNVCGYQEGRKMGMGGGLNRFRLHADSA